HMTRIGGTPEAGVVAGGFRIPVENAAFINATMAHASELEDNQVPEMLSTYWVFPAFFSLAEILQSSGREMIEAAIISFEIYSRYGRALPAVEMMRKLFACPPDWFGPIAVAAAAARMLKLSADQIETAMSISTTMSCGVCSGGWPGTDTHYVASGTACRNGLMSAFLAKEGATAGKGVLELAVSQLGNVCFEGQGNPDILTDGLGEPPYSILNCCIKKYSACTLTHPAVDAFGLLMKEHGFSYDDVESIEVESGQQVHEMVATCYNPINLEQARFSIPFLLAEVLLRGKIDESTYVGPEKIVDPQNREVQGKITVKMMEGVPYEYPGSRVTVVKKDGQKMVKHLEDRIGSPIHPLTLEQIRDVARPFLSVMLNETQCDRVEEIMVNLEKQPDILELMDIITFARVGRRA
ncbi:MmgE/PrpD family protein, partial [Chloroflexota bacterium]